MTPSSTARRGALATRVRPWIAKLIRNFAVMAAALVCLVLPARRRLLVWGPVPILSNRYWSEAMRGAGLESVTLMEDVYDINARSDFDRYFDDLVPRWLGPRGLRHAVAPACALLWIVRNARVVHLPFSGGPMGQTVFWRLEARLYRQRGIRTLVMPYGGDAYAYSRVIDPSLRLALLMSYPAAARRDAEIEARIAYWSKHADAMITGTMIDGLGRTDVINVQPCCIDTTTWQPRTAYSRHDGRTGPVRILHTPNHRGFKGTEFLIRSVEALQREGLDIDLVLLERVPNEVVRRTMQEVDILAEQFIASVYALSGIEGMASGLPVLVSLASEPHTRAFRRYSYLDECPALSTTPETLTTDLRRLVTDPVLRETLGRAGRRYVEKYHSYAAARYMFGAVYRRILDGEDIDLMRLFDPATSSLVNATPRVEHPLIDNRLPVN